MIGWLKTSFRLTRPVWIILPAVIAGVMQGMAVPAALPAEEASVASITRAVGHVQIRKPGSDAYFSVQRGDNYSVGDMVRTDADGKAQLVFRDGSYIVMANSTAVRVSQYAFDERVNRRTARIKLLGGKIRVVLFKTMKDNSRFEVETEHAVIKPSMLSDLLIDVRGRETITTVLNGGMAVKNVLAYIVGSMRISANMKIVVKEKTSPSAPEILTADERSEYVKEFIIL